MTVSRKKGDKMIRGIMLLVAVVALLVPGTPGYAQDDRESPGFAVFSGRVTFQRYCASCHGPEALGDGNIAQYLKVQPADLTQLQAKNDGAFPTETIHEYIDGRQDVRGHGTREMPVWGEVFQSTLSEPRPGEEEGEQRADRIIHQLVMYLESIQAKE